MLASGTYIVVAILLFVVNLAGWVLTALSLPGNWLILIATALFALFVRTEGSGIGWPTIVVLLGLAIIGEIIETAAGAAGAARSGGSRRGMILSIIGAIIGSIGGAIVSVPIPIFGPPIGAVFGGAVGAFIGALLGESWKGRALDHGMQVGQAAFLGRIFGTVGKLIAGAVMLVIATLDLIF